MHVNFYVHQRMNRAKLFVDDMSSITRHALIQTKVELQMKPTLLTILLIVMLQAAAMLACFGACVLVLNLVC